MIFGLSWTKALVIISLAFLCFGVPIMGFLVTLKERRDRRRERDRNR